MNKKRIKFLRDLFAIISYALLFLPITVWILLNVDKYFVHKSGMTVGLGGIMAILFIVLLLKCGFKKFNKAFWVSFLLAIVFCLNTIIVDLLPITFFAWVGVILFAIFEIPMNYYKRKYETYSEEEIRVHVRNEYSDTYKGNGRC